MNNPFTLDFGKEPTNIVTRLTEMDTIIGSFRQDTPSSHIYMITGMRGSGKTVLMTSISKELKKEPEWIVVNLNPERDLLQALAAKLCSYESLADAFRSAKINLSFFHFGIEIDNGPLITDIEVALERMLQNVKKSGKKLLITIDEVTNTSFMKVFAGSYQMFLREDLPVFLLMTGLYENIEELQNEKNLTFLYRAPKVRLEPLNLRSMAKLYEQGLGVSSEVSIEMARLTKGYSYAFQVLGYLTYKEENRNYQNVVEDLRQYLEDYIYRKIWSKLSVKDRSFLMAIATSENGKIKDIREKMDISNNSFNPYRKRLIDKDLVNGNVYGHVFIKPPLFEEFIIDNMAE